MSSSEPWAQWISIETVFQLHRQGIEAHGGGGRGVPDVDCVQRSLGAAYNAEIYNPVEGVGLHGLCFAGCLLFYLSNNSCFPDGNKRVAWASAMRVLLSFGLTVRSSTDEAEQFCMDIATGKVKSAQDVTFWLADNITTLPN